MQKHYLNVRREKLYLHLGNESIVPTKEIIGIFDIDKCSIGRATKAFLKKAFELETKVYLTKKIVKQLNSKLKEIEGKELIDVYEDGKHKSITPEEYANNNKGVRKFFYKGDLKQFVIERIADKCIDEFILVDNSVDWYLKKDLIIDTIRCRKKGYDERIGINGSNYQLILLGVLQKYKDYYWKGIWKSQPEWDRVFVTTLFTFYWDITIETINFAKYLVKDQKNLMVGGILASIQPEELELATGIKPFVGVLDEPGIIDKNDKQIIDELPLDYSILDEIDYQYPMTNAYYGYMTRGCIRKCPFCAVPILEPIYNSFIPLSERIQGINERYGAQKDLLLMDNNVLASKEFPKIIDEIISCGFYKGAKFRQPNLYEIATRNLIEGINDRAYIRKSHRLINELYQKITNEEESYDFYKILEKYHLIKLQTTTKNNLIDAFEEIRRYYDKHFRPLAKRRYVDFNQGLDARLFDEENVVLLSKIAIHPLRIAFDDMKILPAYEKAIRLSVKNGIKDFSNYLLYNFHDKPIELYRRLKINVDLCEELNVNIYSFPMKYHPLKRGIEEVDYSHNRDYIGEFWNRKYIRAVQAILNSTKGKVGKGQSFFYEAFGHNEEEFLMLLEMPETFILYRFFFKWLDTKCGIGATHWKKCWDNCKNSLSKEEWGKVLLTIHNNDFTSAVKSQFSNVPSYEDYADVVAGMFANHFKGDEKPVLFTELGTTLVNKYIK